MIRNALLEVFGDKVQVSQLDTRLACRYIAPPRQLNSDMWYAAVAIDVLLEEKEDGQEDAVATIHKWLESRSEHLSNLTARKKLEIQTGLLPNWGCDGFELPIEFLRLLVQSKCEFAVQYSRVLSKEEMAALRHNDV